MLRTFDWTVSYAIYRLLTIIYLTGNSTALNSPSDLEEGACKLQYLSQPTRYATSHFSHAGRFGERLIMTNLIFPGHFLSISCLVRSIPLCANILGNVYESILSPTAIYWKIIFILKTSLIQYSHPYNPKICFSFT